MVLEAALLVLLAAPPPAPAPGDLPYEPGTWWEQTMEVQMPGMAIPPQTMKQCLPKGAWEQPPMAGEQDDNCTVTDVKRSGNKMSWKMKCKDGTSGTAEVTTTATSFQGAMTMQSGGQTFRSVVKGKKVGGDCDANEDERKVASMRKGFEAQQEQQAEAQAEMCTDAVKEMQISMFVGVVPGQPLFCADRTADFCKRLESRAGLIAFRSGSEQQGDRGRAEKLCGRKLVEVEKRLCAEAAAEQARGKLHQGEAVEFLFASCPDQAKALAKTECAGRDYTSMSSAQRDFCTEYAQEALDQGEPARPAAPAAPVPDVKREIIRGIFGR